ncbi:hypothetical protein HDU91_006967 [Kappamyces sp. JEL0680]|nr:hypothetical protein HDU91_006967 [Kappamyces sp. JEL0680]
MLPLVFESAIAADLLEEVLSWFLVLDRMVRVKLESPEALANLKVIRDYLDSKDLDPSVTTHEWFAHLPQHVKKAFDEIANAPVIIEGFNSFFPAPAYKTVVLESMNEIYVATTDTTSATSDNVFYSNHVDGPFMCYPFASVYRAIVAVNSNDFIKTIFPAHPCEKVITDGEVWAFDFNREVHRIEQIKPPTGQRYTLKLHYLVHLTTLPYYGWVLGQATSLYDTIARMAFLKTLVPKSPVEKALWGFIMLCTRVFYGSIRAAGNSGAISFLAMTSIIMYFTKSELPLFLISSSFIHYFIYISTYYHYETHAKQIAFEGFKSTVMFYKAVAFYHLITTYIANLGSAPDFVSLLMIAFGFTLSGTAAAAIGIDQTYFGVELGRCKAGMRVTGFPYNLTSHPMILGNIIGLLGFMKLDGFRRAMPWLVPVHIALYTIHMLQVRTGV